MAVIKSAAARIMCFNGDPVVSLLQIRQDINGIIMPVILLSAHGTPADILTVDVQFIGLIGSDDKRRR